MYNACTSPHVDGTISVVLLVDAVRSVSDWHSLGLHLDLTMGKLKEIKRIHHVDGEERIKAEMFDVWLKSCPDASWHDLLTALNEIGEKRVAKEVETRYCKQLPGNEIFYTIIITVCRACHSNLLTTLYYPRISCWYNQLCY